jgi:hypothetical protein
MNTPSILTRAVAFAGALLFTLTLVTVVADYALPEAAHTQLAAAQVTGSRSPTSAGPKAGGG